MPKATQQEAFTDAVSTSEIHPYPQSTVGRGSINPQWLQAFAHAEESLRHVEQKAIGENTSALRQHDGM